jgi:hypothetical protein
MVFSAQLAEGETEDACPLSVNLTLLPGLRRPLHPLPRKTSEIQQPVLCHITPLSFSVGETVNRVDV